MKKKYSAPIAEWIDSELEDMIAASFEIVNPDNPGPGSGGEEIDEGYGESHGGGEFDGSLSKSTNIFE